MASVTMAGEENKTILQAFEWYSPPGHWARLRDQLPAIKAMGVDTIWLPPGCKASHPQSVGYDAYDLYDLGEFECKGSRSTKWGSKEDLIELAAAAKANGIGLIWDAVLGHKASADRTEICRAVEVDPEDRTKEIGDWHDIDSWLHFDYTARGDTYSAMKHSAIHFNGLDFDQRTGERALFKLRDWAEDVDHELGNFDYLLCANVDFRRQDVREDLFHWADWIIKEVGLSGFRLDAVKHISQSFMKEFIDRLSPNMLLIGEYGFSGVEVLAEYVERMQHRMHVFDFPFRASLVHLSNVRTPDLRTLFRGSLVELKPRNAVTFIDNHDTQNRGREDEYPIAPWLIPMAYAWILLSTYGGCPCVFWGDLCGVQGPGIQQPPTCRKLPQFMLARKLYAYGRQIDYSNDASCVGFTRHGRGSSVGTRRVGLAVVMTSYLLPRSKHMNVGAAHAGETWINVLEDGTAPVKIDGKGWGIFVAPARRVALYISDTAPELQRLRVASI